MRCPRCRLDNPDTALRCDCGFDFASGTVQESYSKPKLPRSRNTGPSEPVTQRQVTRILRSGIFWSILWLAGIGSLIALLRGLEARRLIQQADRELDGLGGAWWCIVVGAPSPAFCIPYRIHLNGFMPKSKPLTLGELHALLPRLAATAQSLEGLARQYSGAKAKPGRPKGRRSSVSAARFESKLLATLSGSKGRSAGELTKRLGAPRSTLKYYLKKLKRETRVRVVGTRGQAKWFAAK